jgi:hypothetical protein
MAYVFFCWFSSRLSFLGLQVFEILPISLVFDHPARSFPILLSSFHFQCATFEKLPQKPRRFISLPDGAGYNVILMRANGHWKPRHVGSRCRQLGENGLTDHHHQKGANTASTLRTITFHGALTCTTRLACFYQGQYNASTRQVERSWPFR